jgi:acetylornithine deacetylase/succinyl-diaminopimelate desuccinylase family protein
MIDKKRLVSVTRALLRAVSENPPGDERRVAAVVAAHLRGIGLKPRLVSFFPRRTNVLAVLKGKSGGRPLLITPHLDTVPAGKGWKTGPFSGEVRGGKIFGRGATDCKGNLAVALEVLASLCEDRAALRHDVIFLATADEETGSSKGLIPFLEKDILRPAFALILDSDEFNIITAQKGLIHFSVSVKGKKAHGAYPERGVNAIDGASRLIAALKGLRLPRRKHRLLRPWTVNIGTIRGGDKVNMVADWCVFETDLRFLPGMDGQDILRRVRRSFDRTGARYRLEVQDLQQPYEIDGRHPLVAALRAAARGIAPRSEVKGSEGATVITFFKKKGIPAVATGYGASGCAHGTDEYARIGDLYRGAKVLERFIKIFDQDPARD